MKAMKLPRPMSKAIARGVISASFLSAHTQIGTNRISRTCGIFNLAKSPPAIYRLPGDFCGARRVKPAQPQRIKDSPQGGVRDAAPHPSRSAERSGGERGMI